MAKNYLREYLSFRPFHLGLFRAREAEFYSGLKLDSPVLDLGFGDGFFASLVFDRKIDVGIDSSAKYLKEAKETKAYKKLQIVGKGQIPYPDNYFASVVSNSTLEHVLKPDEMVREVYRVLKPGGVFACTVINDRFNQFFLGTKVLPGLYDKYLDMIHTHRHLYSKSGWQKILRGSGFFIVREEEYFSQRAVWLYELCHWFGYFTFISKAIFGRWVLFPQKLKIIPLEKFFRKFTQEKNLQKGGAAVFFLCRKPE